jgi:hypothetical protein
VPGVSLVEQLLVSLRALGQGEHGTQVLLRLYEKLSRGDQFNDRSSISI